MALADDDAGEDEIAAKALELASEHPCDDPLTDDQMKTLNKVISDQMIETGDADFYEKAEIALGVLYATDTLPIRRSALNGSNHKTLAAMIVLMVDQCLQVEVDEYKTTELKASGYSKSFMQYMERADARGVLDVVQRTPHTAIHYVGDSLTGVFADADH